MVIIGEILLFIILKFVIQPRISFVKPGPSLKSIRNKLLIVASIHFISILVIFVLPFIGIHFGIQISGIIFLLIIGLSFMPIFIIIAYLIKYPRLYIIGILIWLAIFINKLFYDPVDYRIRWFFSYGIIGLIILFMGLIIFIRFLKKYPKPKEKVP
ncbi:MAG: hypothetical protein ACFFG0_06945 [Candidatus Thorarchaeota archaeon]